MLHLRHHLKSLRIRAALICVTVALGLFGATIWGTADMIKRMSMDYLASSIRQTAETLNLAVSPHVTATGLMAIQPYLDELVDGADSKLVYLAVLDERGQSLVRTRRTPTPLPDTTAALEEQIAHGVVHVKQPILIYQSQVGSLRYGISAQTYVDIRRQIIWRTSLALLMTLILLIGTITALGWQLNRKIAPLIQASKALASGDLTARATIRGHDDELSALSLTFNQMADAMQERMAEVTQLNEQLEHRVHERTADLQDMVNGLESFNRAVSHDLRGPLGGISGLAELAAQSLDKGDDTLARRALPAIAKQAQITESMLTNLLALARVGDAHVGQEETAIHALVADIIEQLTMSKREYAMPHFVLNDLPTLHTDAALLRPALLNLIGNAVKFSAKSASPQVEIGSFSSDDQFITIFVKDNGPGFAQEDADQLFTPFVRLHGSEFEGHGVGLSIVRRAINKLGGGVWAKGEPGKGATFFFTLPKAGPAFNSTHAGS